MSSAVASPFDTGTPSPELGSAVLLGDLVTGLSEETLYHWRLRIASRSPIFPRSPWIGPAGNASSKADLRTASLAADVAEGGTTSGGVTLDPLWPNPLRGQAEIEFTLPRQAQARLSAYDTGGRQVEVLIDGVLASGRHRVGWLGRDPAGRRLPAGVYLVRLETEMGAIGRKVVIAH